MKLEEPIACFICGRLQEDDEHFIQLEDGFACEECAEELDDDITSSDRSSDTWNSCQDDDGDPLDH